MTQNDKLPEEIRKQIKADAERYAIGIGDVYRKYAAQYGYIAGAAAENERAHSELHETKAQADNLRNAYDELGRKAHRMADALEAIMTFLENEIRLEYLQDKIPNYLKHRETLQQFKDGGKEVSPTEQEIEAEITKRWNSIGYNPIGTRTRESYREEVIRYLTNPTK